MVGYAYGMEFFIAGIGQPLRAVRFREPSLGLRMGLLDHDQLQRHLAPDLLFQEGPDDPWILLWSPSL